MTVSGGAPIELSMGVTTYSADDPGNWQPLLEQVRLLDQAGMDRLVVSDHVVFGEHLEEYGRPEIGGQAGGRQPTGPDGHWLEPITTLSVIAGMTSRIRLGTNILIAALRRPVVLAKSTATLDVLSGGRFDLGVGVGWQKEEYDAAGLDFANRGRLLDHALEVCQTLWQQQRAEYHAPELDFEAIHQMPKPRQPGGVPLWIGGSVNRHVVHRLARFGTGWIPWGPAAADLTSGIAQMKDALHEVGRDPAGLQVVGHLPPVRRADGSLDIDGTMAAVPALVAAGVTDVRARLALPADPSAALDHLRAVVGAFRRAADRPDPV
ncbi:MAG: TIGR03619 family F420-dependent LLM class oxidoreductase [Acidimicrobiales bacterium]